MGTESKPAVTIFPNSSITKLAMVQEMEDPIAAPKPCED